MKKSRQFLVRIQIQSRYKQTSDLFKCYFWQYVIDHRVLFYVFRKINFDDNQNINITRPEYTSLSYRPISYHLIQESSIE